MGYIGWVQNTGKLKTVSADLEFPIASITLCTARSHPLEKQPFTHRQEASRSNPALIALNSRTFPPSPPLPCSLTAWDLQTTSPRKRCENIGPPPEVRTFPSGTGRVSLGFLPVLRPLPSFLSCGRLLVSSSIGDVLGPSLGPVSSSQ